MSVLGTQEWASKSQGWSRWYRSKHESWTAEVDHAKFDNAGHYYEVPTLRRAILNNREEYDKHEGLTTPPLLYAARQQFDANLSDVGRAKFLWAWQKMETYDHNGSKLPDFPDFSSITCLQDRFNKVVKHRAAHAIATRNGDYAQFHSPGKGFVEFYQEYLDVTADPANYLFKECTQ